MSDKWREEQRKKQYGFGIQPTINREIQIRDDRIEELEAKLKEALGQIRKITSCGPGETK